MSFCDCTHQCNNSNGIKKLIESLKLKDVVYYTNLNHEANSTFSPGNSPDQKQLKIIMTSEHNFSKGTSLTLKLVGYIDNENVRHPLKKIKTIKKVSSRSKEVTIILTNERIPLPKNVAYLPTFLSNCDPSLEFGTAIEYCFVLYIKHECGFKCSGIPLYARYFTGAICDVKCEIPDCVDVQDDDHPIIAYCNYATPEQRTIYCSLPHCVTHCQAERPVLFYYDVTNIDPNSVTRLVNKNCTNCDGS